MAVFHPPSRSSHQGSAERSLPEGFHTFESVQERLVEAMRLWWQCEGGRWPFAADGPWHLIRKEWEDWDARDPKPLRRLPLSREQIAERDEATEWLRLLDERDRRLVVLAVAQRAAGRRRVRWSRLLRPLGMTSGAGALAQRYSRAVGYVAFRLNGTPHEAALRLVQRRGTGWEAVIGRQGAHPDMG